MPVDCPGCSRETAITITDLNERTRTLSRARSGRFWVNGEVTDFKTQRTVTGTSVFVIVVPDGVCGLGEGPAWNPGAARRWNAGRRAAQLSMFPANGRLQLRIGSIEAAGEGLWRKAMEQTIERLNADGLLAPERKRPIPRYPRVVAIVTSMTGAALRDIVSVARRRRPGCASSFSGAAVQGDDAPAEISRAIGALSMRRKPRC